MMAAMKLNKSKQRIEQIKRLEREQERRVDQELSPERCEFYASAEQEEMDSADPEAGCFRPFIANSDVSPPAGSISASPVVSQRTTRSSKQPRPAAQTSSRDRSPRDNSAKGEKRKLDEGNGVSPGAFHNMPRVVASEHKSC